MRHFHSHFCLLINVFTGVIWVILTATNFVLMQDNIIMTLELAFLDYQILGKPVKTNLGLLCVYQQIKLLNAFSVPSMQKGKLQWPVKLRMLFLFCLYWSLVWLLLQIQSHLTTMHYPMRKRTKNDALSFLYGSQLWGTSLWTLLTWTQCMKFGTATYHSDNSYWLLPDYPPTPNTSDPFHLLTLLKAF